MDTNGAELIQDGSGQSFAVNLCHTLMNQLDIMGPEEGRSDGCASSDQWRPYLLLQRSTTSLVKQMCSVKIASELEKSQVKLGLMN